MHLKIIIHNEKSYFDYYRQEISKFADFQSNNNVFTQKNCAFKKYQPQEKFINWQLIANFSIFGKIIKDLCKKNHALGKY